jgi:homoserine kinase
MALAPFAVRVPATSANLGPGFDALGLALGIYNTVRVAPAPALEIVVAGEGAGALPRDPRNLLWRAACAALERAGVAPPAVRLACDHQIPLARGLGSSSAAIVAGLLVGNRLAGDRLRSDELLALAVALEGHPDNVTPALLGGVRVCVQGERGVYQAAVPLARPLHAALFVPDRPLPTAEARRVLPDRVSLGDAVYNLGRAALLVAALASGEYHLLAEATRDRLHQPARARLLPALPTLLEAALAAGALGACLSGAGPTVLALVEDAAKAARVGEALLAAAARAGERGRLLTAPVGVRGAEVMV